MSPQKKIIFVSTRGLQGESVGGGELFAIECIRELQSRGWKVDLIAPEGSPILRVLQGELSGFYPLSTDVKIRDFLLFVTVTLRFLALARRNRQAVFYGNTFESLKWVALAKLGGAKRTVCHLHESFYAHYYSRRARYLQRWIARFFAISKKVKLEFMSGSGCDESKVALIPNGVAVHGLEDKPTVRIAIRNELNIPQSSSVMCMAARTDKLKGHEIFIRAIPPILDKFSEAYFVIVGLVDEEPERQLYQSLQNLIRELGVGNNLRCLGYRQDARRIMQGADVVVVPSTSEGFGRVAIEGMAEGTVVVASAVGGLLDIIESNQTGVLFPSGDFLALSKIIGGLLIDRQGREQLAQAGRKAAELRYSTAAMVDRIEKELMSL